MRLILLIAVIALAVDAFYFSGAYTQSAVRQLSIVAEDVQSRMRDRAEEARAEPDNSVPPANGVDL